MTKFMSIEFGKFNFEGITKSELMIPKIKNDYNEFFKFETVTDLDTFFSTNLDNNSQQELKTNINKYSKKSIVDDIIKKKEHIQWAECRMLFESFSKCLVVCEIIINEELANLKRMPRII